MLYHSCSNLPINKMVGLNNTTVRAESSTFFIYLFILIEGYFFNYRILIKKSFREFCCFLSNLNMNQPPFWTSLPGPFPSHLSRLMQSPCLSFPGHTTSSRWLSSLHMVMQVSMLLFSLIWLVITGMQVKMRYHLTSVRMATIKKATNNRCWRGCVERKPLYTVGGNVNWYSHYGK